LKKLKVITIVGTRPEIIRLSRLIPKLDEYTDHILVHTGQNSDPKLNDIFFSDLELRQPDYYLGVDTSSMGAVMGETLKKSEEVFLKEKPDAETQTLPLQRLLQSACTFLSTIWRLVIAHSITTSPRS
jgi:UDP-N-acetyl-L-fucosamine synthase